jgi:hypothetical protein
MQEHFDQLRAGRQQMLAVVEHEEQLFGAERIRKGLRHRATRAFRDACN